MAKKAIAVNKKSRGRPRVDAVLVGVRIPPKLIAALDEFCRKTGIGRQEAIRLILKDWLPAHGMLAAPLDISEALKAGAKVTMIGQGGSGGVQTFKATGKWTKPKKTTKVVIEPVEGGRAAIERELERRERAAKKASET